MLRKCKYSRAKTFLLGLRQGHAQTSLFSYLEISPVLALNTLLDFSLTVKAATLIFISGCGSAISSAKEGKSGSIYKLVESKYANVHAFNEILTVYTLNSHLLTLKAHNHKMHVFVVH